MRQYTTLQEWIDNSDIVRAAHQVAQRAHATQVRDRKNGNAPYIGHPELLAELLLKLSKADELNLAVALLHDVPEDGERYKQDPHLFAQDLCEELRTQGLHADDAEIICRKIAGHCMELTNPDTMPEGKRIYQIDHIRKLSQRSRLIKLVDQAATVIDDIRFESLREPDKLDRFAFKGLNIAKTAMATGDDGVKLAYHLYKDVFSYYAKLAKMTPEEAAQARQAFDINTSIRSAMTHYAQDQLFAMKPFHLKRRVIAHPAYGAADRPRSGCVIVNTLEGKGKIHGFAMLITTPDAPEALAGEYMVGAIESIARKQRVTIGETRVFENRLVRQFVIKPPMELDDFRAATAKATQLLQDEPGAENAAILDNRFLVALGKQFAATRSRVD